ncbi:endoplasmic reticulum metallopeptidase 1 [Drosophila willistoni]|uniref:endoplasmic reticulum metallopeptidase 1 n=1 Tax=Drosophila willistoni TaxID=7260 RepID=UPI000C26D151|nr:endoplasmic reticulum metallopeptidase 1 [Drosophila willistoni]
MWRSVRSRLLDACQNRISDEPVESGSSLKRQQQQQNTRVPWYLASGFLLFWVLLFYAVVIPLFYRLPTGLTIEDVSKGGFIAERAQNNLYNLAGIGPKVVGSDANENQTVAYLMSELELIEQNVLTDYFDLEIDVQVVSGSYIHWTMINMYQGVQNIVIKLSPKNTTSESYLLVNSHFDSKPTSPSAGDAGFMVVTILEVLRVMSRTKQTFEHPIVFLLNGAEENPLEASHGFITQHEWAPFIKAVVNLDAAGSGGREILFQSGPNNPWLVDAYKNNARHPFATTMAEEIFQTGLLPSDTDFTIFTKYGNLIGLDMAQCINGFLYHTKYDRYDAIPRNAYQNTGDNVLSLVRALSNATQLHNPSAYATGHAVFFDFLGLYFVSYSATTGVYLNYIVAASSLLLVFISLWRIADVSHITTCNVSSWFILILILQIIAFVLGVGLPVVVAYVMDMYGLSLTYFSTPALLIGLYVCPSLLGLSLPTFIYFKLQRNDKISFGHHLQLALHGHAVVLALVGIALTVYGLRSAYVITWTLIFYVIPLALNLLTTLHDRGYSWSGLLKAVQILPFLYNSYLFYTFLTLMVSMMGRFGRGTNPDLIVSALTALGSVLALGFLLPLINMFRRPSFVLLILLAVSGLTIYTATSTQIGFPYRPKTNVERIPFLHVRRIFHEYDGTVSKDESGYLFNFQDRRGAAPLKAYKVNLTGLVSIESDCNTYMFCGLPLYDHRWVKNRLKGMWLPREDPITPPGTPDLQLVSKTILADYTTVRLEYNLTGPDHMSLFIQPYEDVVISNWSFLTSYIQAPGSTSSYPPPYHIYFTYGKDKSPLQFFIELTKADGDFDVPVMQLGVSGHYISSPGDAISTKFVKTIPPFAVTVDWPATYHRYIF